MQAKQIDLQPILIKQTSMQELIELIKKEREEAYQQGLKDAKKSEWASAEETAEMLGVHKYYLSQIRAKPDCCLVTRKRNGKQLEYLIESIEQYKNNK